MAAPIGNTNSSKNNRLWAETIRRAIKQSNPEKLREIADKLIEMAAAGDLAAIKELGDRLDGKSHQSADVSVEHSGSIEHRGLPEISGRVADLLGRRADSDSPPLLPH